MHQQLRRGSGQKPIPLYGYVVGSALIGWDLERDLWEASGNPSEWCHALYKVLVMVVEIGKQAAASGIFVASYTRSLVAWCFEFQSLELWSRIDPVDLSDTWKAIDVRANFAIKPEVKPIERRNVLCHIHSTFADSNPRSTFLFVFRS